jgi:hypothetical protein
VNSGSNCHRVPESGRFFEHTKEPEMVGQG